MSSRLGPIHMNCDAPPCSIVEACANLSFQAPMDVRWCRASQLAKGRHDHDAILGFHALAWLLGGGRSSSCTCGQPLPLMERYTFTFASGREASYLLGQCRRCRTIFWEDAPTAARKEMEPGSG
jgi:hypothetical protein